MRIDVNKSNRKVLLHELMRVFSVPGDAPQGIPYVTGHVLGCGGAYFLCFFGLRRGAVPCGIGIATFE
jgi:hypothetical protein